MGQPSYLLARIKTEWDRRVEGESWVLPCVVVARRKPTLRRTLHDAVHNLESWYNFPWCINADREITTSRCRNVCRESLSRSVEDVHTRGIARSKTPLYTWATHSSVSYCACFLTPGACTECREPSACASFLQEFPSLDCHFASVSCPATLGYWRAVK